MREIKFRAWDGGHMLSMPICTIFGLSRFFGFLSDDAIIMQFTGLKDKNGKEIYEGDLVHSDSSYYNKPITVYWNNEMTGYFPLLSMRPEQLSVIGNIYENPELIK